MLRNRRLLPLPAAAALLCCCGAGDSPGGVEEGAQGAPEARRLALASDSGLVSLLADGEGPFKFGVQVAADEVAAGVEYDLAAGTWGKLVFTAMAPDPYGGEVSEAEGAVCWIETAVDGEEREVCEVPYVGYGTDAPVPVTIEPSAAEAHAYVYFHEFGINPGEEILLDYLFVLARKDEDGACRLYYDFSRSPVRYVVGGEIVEDGLAAAALGDALAGPVFPAASAGDGCTDLGGHPQPCTLDLFPQPLEDFCPMPDKPADAVFPSHWLTRCSDKAKTAPEYLDN